MVTTNRYQFLFQWLLPGDFGGNAHRGTRWHSMQSFGGHFHSKITWAGTGQGCLEFYDFRIKQSELFFRIDPRNTSEIKFKLNYILTDFEKGYLSNIPPKFETTKYLTNDKKPFCKVLNRSLVFRRLDSEERRRLLHAQKSYNSRHPWTDESVFVVYSLKWSVYWWGSRRM